MFYDAVIPAGPRPVLPGQVSPALHETHTQNQLYTLTPPTPPTPTPHAVVWPSGKRVVTAVLHKIPHRQSGNGDCVWLMMKCQFYKIVVKFQRHLKASSVEYGFKFESHRTKSWGLNFHVELFEFSILEHIMEFARHVPPTKDAREWVGSPSSKI